MALQNQIKVFILSVLLSTRSDCKGIGSTERPYPGCGVKIDLDIGGTTVGGTEVEENAYPWMAFLYNYDRKFMGMDVMDLDLPEACKSNRTRKTATTTTSATTITTSAPSFPNYNRV